MAKQGVDKERGCCCLAYRSDANTSYYYGFFELQPAGEAPVDVWR